MKFQALIAALLFAIAPLLIVTPLIVTSGCTTSAKTTAYKTLKSVQDASVAGLEMYGAACRRNEVDAATRARVRDAYSKYQSAFAVAIDVAQMDYSAPPPAALTEAVQNLLNLVAVFKR